ncbi:MAG: FIST N-terminal domain-containing protein [Planctomycetota bacterium]
MPTHMAVGHAATGDGRTQGVAAATQAREALGREPLFGIVFATSQVDLAALSAGVAEVLGDVPFIGCSTAGEFTTGHVSAGGTAVTLVASDALGVAVASAEGLRSNTPRAVRSLAQGLRTPHRAPPPGAAHGTVLLLCDGMAGNGEGLVDALAMELGAAVAITGGAAGDDAAFKETEVFVGSRVLKDAVVGIQLTSARPLGVGVHHGWCAASAPGEVTAAEGATLIAIDGKPAIEFYRAYAEKIGFELTPENQNQFVFTHELGLVLMNGELKVRAPLSVNPDGSIHCATEVPVGQTVRVVEGDHDAIVAAARQAAEQAVKGLGGAKAAGAIVFDCVARKLVLGDAFAREVQAFEEVVGAPVLGFNTYGEIARVRGQLSGFHNTTAVVVALPA